MPGRTRRQYRKWALARFFYDLHRRTTHLPALTTEIESRVAAGAPDVEVLLVEADGDALRVFIDRADGVSLADCERVTALLADYRETYAIEVSSPGEDRPLTKPQHFTRFLGRRARLRLREARDGHKSLTGELVGASANEVTIAAGEGVVSIPYELIARSNLVPGE
ncbi:MAG: ribosome maturation factor RimP [Solirubrobacteraceae bacterium]